MRKRDAIWILILWIMMLRGLVGGYEHFGETGRNIPYFSAMRTSNLIQTMMYESAL
jgi:hypothetical protein